jgi:hypothetical protein
MRRDHRTLTDERGESLPLALIVLAVGSLLMAPLLAQVSSGFQITAKVEQTTRAQYTSDAGIEYALWLLANDADFRGTVLGSPGTAQDLTLPETVNDGTPGVRVVAVDTEEVEQPGSGAMLQYAIFGNNTSRTNTVVMSGSGHRVNGDVHSNNQIRITGSGNCVSGTVTYAGDISVVGSGNYFIPSPPINPSLSSTVLDFPLTWDLKDFAPVGAIAEATPEGLYTVHDDRWQVSGAGTVIPPGLHYCEDDVNISGSGITGTNVTIVSLKKIDVSGSGITFTPYVPGLTFYSAKESTTSVISISGSGNTGGTAYAPGGKIALTGSGGTITGAFIGDRVDIAGSGATIQLAEIPLPGGGSETCGVYDIESIAGTTRTLARATDCDAEGLRIISWHVH